MRVLLAHNRYGSASPSGENVAYEIDRDVLRAGGHEVWEYVRDSDELHRAGALGALRGAAATPWNPFAARAVARLVSRERIEVLHVHNFFPLLSPSVFGAARGRGAATVFTLHNCRVFCAAGIPLREGRPCTACLDGGCVTPALRHRCYRGSLAATAPLAAMIAASRARRTWERDVDAFIVFTEFQRDLMARAGIPAGRTHVAPPCYPDAPDPVPFERREAKAIYVGRLGAEKGVDVLLRGWSRWGDGAPRLEIVGDGPERGALEGLAAALGLGARVVFSGLLPFAETQRRLASARLLLQPSRCFEGFPMTLREAMALGVPMAGSRRGAIPGIIREGETGILFEPGDAEDLAARVGGLWGDPAALAAMAGAARRVHDSRHTAAAHLADLSAVYAAAVRGRAAAAAGARA